MTSNQEQVWRLEDEEGNQLGEAPQEGGWRLSDWAVYQGAPLRRATVMDWGGPTSILAEGAFIGHYMTEGNVQALIRAEVDRYRGRIGGMPEYISLNGEMYRELARTAWSDGGMRRRVENYMGIEVMCNPLQREPVMVLGTGRQEGYGRGLYDEQ